MNDVTPAANAAHLNVTLTPEGMARLTARIRLRERVSIGKQLTDRANVLRGAGHIALAEELDVIASELTSFGQLAKATDLAIEAQANGTLGTFTEPSDGLPQVGLRSDEEDIARLTPSFLRTGGIRD